jgi:hypothetical protein
MSDGLLEKLKIIPFDTPNTVQDGLPVDVPFICQFNPETFSVSNEISYNTEQTAAGASGGEARQIAEAPREYQFEFMLDGTGASGPSIDVTLMIELFKKTTGFDGSIHRHRYLLLQWGLFASTCVLKQYTINYKLFRSNGTPLRAVLSATFVEHKTLELQALLKNLQSPDVTESHLIKEGQRLDQLVFSKYDDHRYCAQVAKHNSLDTIRRLHTSSEITLPPLKSAQKDAQ